MREYNVEIKFKAEAPEVLDKDLVLNTYIRCDSEVEAHRQALKRFENLFKKFTYIPYDIRTSVVSSEKV